jgi:uncharacterized protein YxjI
VKDKDDRLVYKVDSKSFFLSWRHEFHVEDSTGTVVTEFNQIYYWLEKFVNGSLLTYPDPLTGEKKSGVIRRHLKFGFPTSWKAFTFVLDGVKYESHGNFFNYKFSITRVHDNREVVKVELDGQDFILFRWPGLQAYNLKTDTTILHESIAAVY